MNNYINQKYIGLLKVGYEHNQTYRQADPFPNIYFKDFFNPEILDKVLLEFPDLSKEEAISYNNPKEKKLAGKGEKSFGEETANFMRFLNSEPFLEFLQTLTGIKETLLGDPYFSGGGLHEIKRGGFLKIHADFNKHLNTNLDRRINVLIYLNKNWKEEYGGYFELWGKDMKHCEKRIPPEFNTVAIFSTTDFSYHGHPDSLNCPIEMSRKSLALYYYTNGRPATEINPELTEHGTLFHTRVGNRDDKQDFPKKVNFSLKQVVKDITPPFLLKGIKLLLRK